MKKKLKIWGIVAGSSLVLIVSVALALKHWMSGSATGTVSVGTPTAHQEAALQKAPDMIHVDTSYFTAVLPAGFTVKRNVETPNTPLAMLQFAANTNQATDQQVAITIGTLPAGGISQLGDYNLRTTDTANYTKADVPDLPAGAVAFHATTSPAALAIFWPQGSRYAEIGLTTDGASTLDKLQATSSQLISQWTWK